MNSADLVQPAREVARLFRERFRTTPRVFRAPGRVNLIGEHTDYTGGLVMPAAIQLATWVAAGPRDDRLLVLYSEALDETATIDLNGPVQPRQRWSDYVAGVSDVMQEMGRRVRGANLLVSSTVPRGAGLSSSAALAVASGYALLAMADEPIDRASLAQWAQRAESEFVGARVGIMDQLAACFGEPGAALMIDCRSLERRSIPIPRTMAIVVCNTMVRHSIARGEYNSRRAECEQATALIAREVAHVRSLRDATTIDLEQCRDALPPTLLKRARHIVTENERVLQAAEALSTSQHERLRELMGGSHASLRDDFEVSCRELDLMVDLAASQRGVIGTRMTGGGFGGCTVSLVEAPLASEFVASIQHGYAAATGVHPETWICAASGGVEESVLDA